MQYLANPHGRQAGDVLLDDQGDRHMNSRAASERGNRRNRMTANHDLLTYNSMLRFLQSPPWLRGSLYGTIDQQRNYIHAMYSA